MAIQTYRDQQRAERATATRSRNAATAGDCSQYELRRLGVNGFVGGQAAELARQFPGAPIVAQWSAGYRVRN